MIIKWCKQCSDYYGSGTVTETQDAGIKPSWMPGFLHIPDALKEKAEATEDCPHCVGREYMEEAKGGAV